MVSKHSSSGGCMSGHNSFWAFEHFLQILSYTTYTSNNTPFNEILRVRDCYTVY